MANWAYVNYVVRDTKENLKKIYDAIATVLSEGNDDWEGNVLMLLGMSKEDVDKYSLRGSINYLDGVDFEAEEVESISFSAEEAWSTTEFCEALSDLFSGIEVFWYCEEPGNEVYETNDSDGEYFSARYVVEEMCNDWPEDYHYPESEEELFKLLFELSDEEITDWKSLEEYNEKHEDKYFNIHEIIVV
jgi:hypothetical protein